MTRLRYTIAALLVAVAVPAAVHAANWNVVPSVETTLTYANNFTFAPKGREEGETVLEVKPAISVQSTEGRTQLGLFYGIDNLYYANNSDRNAVQQLLRSNASAEVLRDLFFVTASGSISYQSVKPSAATNLGNLAILQDSTEVTTWALSPYFRQTFGSALDLRAGMNLNVVNYKRFLPDSFLREYFVNAASGPSAQDLRWKLDLRSSQVYYKGELSNSRHDVAELDLRYKILPQWALTGRMGYVDYKYDYDPLFSDEPKGKTWRAGVAWVPSTRTELEVGVSKTFISRAKYGSFVYQGQWLFWNVNVDEVVTDRRQLLLDDKKPVTDPIPQQVETVNISSLTESQEVFVNKAMRLRTGYKSDDTAIEVFGYRDRRHFQKTNGTEVVSGGGATLSLVLSRQTSVQMGVSRANLKPADTSPETSSTSTKTTDLSASLLRTFGTGLHASLNVQRRAGQSTDELQTDFVAYLISVRVRMDF